MLEQIKPLQPVGQVVEFKFETLSPKFARLWVQVQAPACHLAITPEGYSRTQ